MDILSIGEILIDLTQTGVNAEGVPLYAANPGGARPICLSRHPGSERGRPSSARSGMMPSGVT